MIEIRPIREEEGDAFLRLLCEVFDLDFHRARTVFYSEPFFDLGRKWALFEFGRMVSILTTTPLEFGFGRAVGIAGVATIRGARRQGHAERLLAHVLDRARVAGESPALLFAERTDLYGRLGFEPLDMVVAGEIVPCPNFQVPDPVPPARVAEIYASWASGSSVRLRRDERRWRLWHWNLRSAESFQDGYVCVEGSLVREAIYARSVDCLPVGRGVQWVGLERMTAMLGVPLAAVERRQTLMGVGFTGAPEMFMSDQF